MQTGTNLRRSEVPDAGSRIEPRVLLFSPDETQANDWHYALIGTATTVISTRLEDLDQLLATERADVVVCPWREALFDRIQQGRRGVRVIFYGELPEAALEAVAEGYAFLHAQTHAELRLRVTAVKPSVRAAPRLELAEKFFLTCAESEAEHPLADVSNEGLSFYVDVERGASAFLPGEVLTSICVRRGDESALNDVSGIIRHVAVEGDWYRVGCELRATRSSMRPSRSTEVRDPSSCIGLVRGALRGPGITFHSTSHTSRGVHMAAAAVHVKDNIVSTDKPCAEFELLEIVRATFEQNGRICRFTTVVTATNPFQFRLPDLIDASEQRCVERHRLVEGAAVTVELNSPFFDSPTVRSVFDLSAAGLSFEIQSDREVYPMGMIFSSVTLRIGSEVVKCRGQLRTVSRLAGGGSTIRCGLAFVDLDARGRARIAAFLTQSRFPDLQDGSSISFDDLLAMFRRVGFMPAEKERVLIPMLDDVRATFRALGTSSNELFKSATIREGGVIVGYVSTTRMYRNTLMFQHLAGAPKKNTGGPLFSLIVEHLLAQLDYEYAKFFMLKNNPFFPGRVLGPFGRKVFDPMLCDMRLLAHVNLDVDCSLPAPQEPISLSEGLPQDLMVVEKYFVGRERGLLLRSDDLTQDGLQLDEVDRSYRKIGLFRRRHVLVARHRGEVCGFALAEVSSPGLNLSEGLSSFRMFLTDYGIQIQDDVRKALLMGLQAIYRRHNRRYSLGLIDVQESAAYSRIGLDCPLVSSAITVHRSQLRLLAEHVRRASIRPARS